MCFCLKKQLSGGVISDPEPILTPNKAFIGLNIVILFQE